MIHAMKVCDNCGKPDDAGVAWYWLAGGGVSYECNLPDICCDEDSDDGAIDLCGGCWADLQEHLHPRCFGAES